MGHLDAQNAFPNSHIWQSRATSRSGFLGKASSKTGPWKARTFQEEQSVPSVSAVWMARARGTGTLPLEVAVHSLYGHFWAQPELRVDCLIAHPMPSQAAPVCTTRGSLAATM